MKFFGGKIRLWFFDGNLFYFCTSVGKNYSTELTLFQKGGSPFNLGISIALSRKIDHSPNLCARFELFGWTIVDYSFHNIHHAEDDEINSV